MFSEEISSISKADKTDCWTFKTLLTVLCERFPLSHHEWPMKVEKSMCFRPERLNESSTDTIMWPVIVFFPRSCQNCVKIRLLHNVRAILAKMSSFNNESEGEDTLAASFWSFAPESRRGFGSLLVLDGIVLFSKYLSLEPNVFEK
jgi:hypothetical protein